MMHRDREIEELRSLTNNLSARLAAAETAISALCQSVDQLTCAATVQETSIMNLQDRMTHESLSILDIIGDIKAQLEPVYWRVMPSYAAFTEELSRLFRRSKPQA